MAKEKSYLDTYKLCYVYKNIMYFTDNFENQWGDDWNDPFDNSEPPYEYSEDIADNSDCGHLKYIGYLENGGEWIRYAGEEDNMSPESINKGRAAWMYTKSAGGLYGGTTMREAMKWLKKVGVAFGEINNTNDI